MDDKYHLPEGWGKQNEDSPWKNSAPAPDTSQNINEEKIQNVDFSTPWEDDAFSDGEKIDQIDFSSPWTDDSDDDDEKIEEIDFSTSLEEPVETEIIFDTPVKKSSISLEKQEETETPVKSGISLEKQEETETPVKSGISLEKQEETETPVKSSISLEKQEETEMPVKSSISLEKQEETETPVKSSLSLEKQEEPEDSAPTFTQETPIPSPYPQGGAIIDPPPKNHTAVIAVIAVLMIAILAIVVWLVILPMFQGRVNIADTHGQDSYSGADTQPDTLHVDVPAATEAPVTIPSETQPPTTLPPPTEPPTTAPPPTEPPKPVYQVVTGKYTWETAETKAQQMGGHLASIHSEEEWYAVVDAINQAKASLPDLKYIWLGAKSEIDTSAMTVTFAWTDGSDNSWLMNGNAHWYYNATLGISEPSGYDANEYQKNGTLIREPYLMMWMPSDSIAWSMNDVPDVSNYSNYKDSNMGYVIRIEGISNVVYTPETTAPKATTLSKTAPAATTAPKATTPAASPVSVSSCNVKGEINGKSVSGYATSYIVDGGSEATVRDTLGDGWHITAKRTCYSRGTTWYELYDTDDGDYYGWVNARNISFYAEDSAAEVTSCYITGEINGKGVAGFTTAYVVNHGSKTTVRDELGNHWHVTARNTCYSMGLYWYELYDTDDGDYYGWVDGSYIKFYGG